ncbi:MAG TPA: AAA family ATPase [Haloplasmataceae bacterium]
MIISFLSYVLNIDNYKLLKTVLIYGPNKSGKTNLIEGLRVFKALLKKGNVDDFPIELMKNFLVDDIKSVDFELEFLENGSIYTYGVEIHENKKISEYLKINDDEIFTRDSFKGNSWNNDYIDDFEVEILNKVSDNRLFISSLDNFSISNKHLNAVTCFFNKINFF